MKRIRMYNVGFGDCFCLRDRKSSLLVDFGTSNKKIGNRMRDDVFERIISDLSTITKKNLLLTHFHPDHMSGLLYMMGRKHSGKEFGVVYLPDVFSTPRMTGILTLLILSDLMSISYLPGRKVSLTSLLEALCSQPYRVKFLQRGDSFEGKYCTLWPDTEYIGREADQIINRLPEQQMAGWQAISNLADEMRRIIRSMSEEGQSGTNPAIGQEEVAEERKQSARILLARFSQLRKSQELQQLLHYLDSEKVRLREFKDKISIVFQNAKDGELNLLFTGDITPEYLKLITENYDGRIPMYEHYWCIKVPHHGTQSHYFDFSRYTPDNMLIPNGIYYANSRKQERESRTSGHYAGLFYIEDTTMYCASCECCEGYQNGCSCREYEIIEPGYYRDL
ncbi:MAG: MBL fold metallo-hydrolase [Lachnospiraceae bacterium]|nr:MBL fold metallo-hydrolase [Lachnospiraceae bacterium]